MAAKSNQSSFHTRDWAYKSFVDKPSYGVMLKDVLDDAYWSNVAHKLEAPSIIEVLPEGMTYYAKLVVVDCGPGFAKVKLLEFKDLVNDVSVPEQNEILKELALGTKYKAERAGAWFRVKRTSDNEVMKTGFRTLELAEAWARENLQVELGQ